LFNLLKRIFFYFPVSEEERGIREIVLPCRKLGEENFCVSVPSMLTSLLLLRNRKKGNPASAQTLAKMFPSRWLFISEDSSTSRWKHCHGELWVVFGLSTDRRRVDHGKWLLPSTEPVGSAYWFRPVMP
jgi:hypothetical protein